MNANVLNVTERAFEDNSIENAESRTHAPYTSTTFNNNDEIRIKIQQQDSYTFPYNSVVYIKG